MRLVAGEKPPKSGEGRPDEEQESETAPPDSQAEEGTPPDNEDSPPQEDESQQPPENQPLSQWQAPPSSDRPLNRLQEQISLEEARQILEGMQENELRFLQQLRKAPITNNKETGKPDW